MTLAELLNDQTANSILDAKPLFENSKSYDSLGHRKVFETCVNTFEKTCMPIRDISLKATKDNQILVADFVFDSFSEYHGMMLSFISSLNKQKALGVASGAKTFICQNGMIMGDMTGKRKHTSTVQGWMQDFIKYAAEQMYSQESLILRKFDALKEQFLTKEEMAQLAGVMAYEGLLKPNQFGKVIGEIKNPSFNYSEEDRLFVDNNDTKYSFFQHVTHAMKSEGVRTCQRSLKNSVDFLLQSVN